MVTQKLLGYPFDAKLLRRKKVSLKRELRQQSGLIEKRIAVLGGSTTHDIIDMLELFLLGHGVMPVFYESEYAQFWEDAMFGNEALNTCSQLCNGGVGASGGVTSSTTTWAGAMVSIPCFGSEAITPSGGACGRRLAL